jgi:hypothetical protein
MDGGTELTGAQPPAAPVSKGTDQRQERGSGTRGTQWSAHQGSGGSAAVGLREWGNGGGDECGEEGRAPRPFIGLEGERDGRASKGNGPWRWCAMME